MDVWGRRCLEGVRRFIYIPYHKFLPFPLSPQRGERVRVRGE
jgi:hypothetical protein